ncbi:hypothetical protein COV24_00315 [candidate division WWE3 bacterium CG10_big_fil_rev_8_21_14_0_10_32_10]|uniref:GTPase Obg n=1 Tax=candidate division WWE3 bacterium CG10_big_fil_rev_8_21_14_0_10_32_10 TaxID=1975090 RepID=A0A2H0RBG6_UNCKA|nr:MAG: hypothetical protein COV24_00315 [candidate division WWE3 bacterium CG10_big_fil_rev_8_21_14_0_10_32_10]
MSLYILIKNCFSLDYVNALLKPVILYIMCVMIDYTKISVFSGKGGDGREGYKRIKYNAFAGTDGGDGGKGGDVYIKVSKKEKTLLKYKTKKVFNALNGGNGLGNFRSGKNAPDLYLEVPLGTIVYKVSKDNTKKIICDLRYEDSSYLLLKGGKGGFGNAHYKSSTNRTPEKHTLGEKGSGFDLILELKLLSDIGLIGLPSVGKSTLINVLTRGHYKTSAYHFTTLEPNLGILYLSPTKQLLISDLPGLIEGASKGKGLGDEFLRHVERCGLLIHVLDPSQTESYYNSKSQEYISCDLLSSYNVVRKELGDWSSDLLLKDELVVINKSDTLKDNIRCETLKNDFVNKLKGISTHRILGVLCVSAYTKSGIEDIKNILLQKYNDIISHSKSIIEDDSNSKKRRTIDLNNIPNKRIFFNL